MKAIKYLGVGKLDLIDMEKPEVQSGQVLVKVLYCGICGTDIHAYHAGGIFDYELVLGHEAVGIVEEIGDDVSCVSVGDRVAVGPPGDCGNCYACNTGHPNICQNAFQNTLGIGPGTQGAYAEYVLSKYPEHELFKIPDKVTLKQAVLFDVIGVGFHAVRRSELKIGDNAVIAGCGSIGLSVIQSVKLAGAGLVIAFDLKKERRELALKAGADYAFSPEDEQHLEFVHDLLKHASGADVAFEAAGYTKSIEVCIDFLRPGGQLLVVGSDGKPYPMISARLGPKEYDFKFSFTYTREEIFSLFAMIANHKFDTSMFTMQEALLEEAEEKIKLLYSGQLNVARVLLMPNGKVKIS